MYSNSGFRSNTGDAFNFFDAFTGGSFESMSVFALNITPYITSSIIIQLLDNCNSCSGGNAQRW